MCGVLMIAAACPHQLTAAPSGSTWIHHMTALAETTHKEDSLYMQTHPASHFKARARPEGNLCELIDAVNSCSIGTPSGAS